MSNKLPKKAAPKKPVHLQNSNQRVLTNGLQEALLGFNPGGIGTQLTQVDTLFKNNRWYLVSNMRQLLSEAYVEHGLIQAVVDVPVNDAMRGGVTFKSKQLSEEQIEELQIEFKREDIYGNVVGQANKWNRLFGGAAIVIMTNQDPSTPLNVEAITSDSPLEFKAVDMWELYWDKQNVEGFNGSLEEPKFEHYSYYGVKLHKSRVMKMKGLTAPSFIRPRLRGWGFSIVEALINSINQYLKSNNLAFEVLDEFKVDVYGIEGLTQTLASAGGTEKIMNRIRIANREKSFRSAITMDSKDKYEQKQVSFAGLAEMMREFRFQIASDMRMPVTKIFGVSSTGSGLGSQQDDLENYNAMVESEVRAKSHFELLEIAKLKCQKKWQVIPTDLQCEYKPLRVMSAEQEETVKDKKFARCLQARSIGEMDSKEFKEACNKDNLLPTLLDSNRDTLPAPGAEDQEGDDPANRTDSQRKPKEKKEGD